MIDTPKTLETHRLKAVVFDLDGTLAPSKGQIDKETAELLQKLLETHIVAIMSGGALPQFEEQLLPFLDLTPETRQKLFLLPTSGAGLYTLESGTPVCVYEQTLSPEERIQIREVLEEAVDACGLRPEHVYGELIEDRGSQVTYSGLGSTAPLAEKEEWDPERAKRTCIIGHIGDSLPFAEIRMGGTTSIDITLKGIDKAYGIRQLEHHLNIAVEDMLFVGDALFSGGNDSAVEKTGIRSQPVAGPEETKTFIRSILGS